MNTAIKDMFAEAEGRYLQTDEIKALAGYTASLKGRVETMQALERAEEKIISETLDHVFQVHPELGTRYAMAPEKCARDVTLVLRFCALAMVRDDLDYLKDKLLFWMRTILQAFNFGPIIDTTYRTLAQRVEAHLDAGQVQLMAPYLRVTHEILTAEHTHV